MILNPSYHQGMESFPSLNWMIFMQRPSGQTMGRIVGLVLVTIFALFVMLASSSKWFSLGGNKGGNGSSEITPAEAPATVAVQALNCEVINIVRTYTGTVHPFEKYTLAFEIAGRVESLGAPDRLPLDEGDRVERGETLAILDRTLLVAQKAMAASRLEEAQANLHRSRELQNRQPGVVSETEIQRLVTAVTVTEAENAIAEKNLEDATLVSPCKGVISRRLVNVGESISMHEPVFEIVDVDKVLLIVGVPQSQVQEIDERRRTIEQNANSSSLRATPQDEEDLRMIAQVEWIRLNPYLDQPHPTEGNVYRIAATADSDGLFKVEILLPNENHLLRPGQIGRAMIVIDRLNGYRLPLTAAIHRDNQAYLFTVDSSEESLETPVTMVDDAIEYRARRIPISRWIEQGSDIVIPADVIDGIPGFHVAVVRGQHRLVHGSPVHVVPIPNADKEEDAPRSPSHVSGVES